MFPLASASTQRSTGPRPVSGAEAGPFEGAAALKDHSERLLATLVKSLGLMAGTSTTVEGTLLGFRRVTLRDHLSSQAPGAVSSVIECAGIGCSVLASMDAALVHAIVELLCGGSGGECRPEEMRPATSIDVQYAHTIAALAAAALAAEWQERGFTGAKAVKLEGAPALDVCGAATREVGVVTLAIAIFGLRGQLALALPPAALQAFGGEAEIEAPAPALDPQWSLQLRQELTRAAVKVDVLLDAVPLSLRTLSELKAGQLLALPAGARTRASLVCQGRLLYRGEIGQDDARYSLRIEEAASPLPASPDALLHRTPSHNQDLIRA